MIGASWGGLDALERVLGALPEDFRSADRDRPAPRAGRRADGTLERAARRTLAACPVREVDDKQPIEPGTVYLAPPDYHLLVEGRGHLALSLDDAVLFSRPSIDVLFESAADAYGDRLVGCSSPGANEDGADGHARRSSGAAASRSSQDPRRPSEPEMPRAAMRAVEPDQVLPLDRDRRRWPSSRGAREGPRMSRHASVLIVDDQPRTCSRSRRCSSRSAANVVEARSGEEALKRLLHDDFAVILLDVQMPDMDGFETAELIKQPRAHAATSRSSS